MNHYQERRERLASALASHSGWVMLASGQNKVRQADVDHPFRVNSHFYYLTGISRAESICVIGCGDHQGQAYVFTQDYDPVQALWHGQQLKLSELSKAYEIECRAIEQWPVWCRDHVQKRDNVWTVSSDHKLHQQLGKYVQTQQLDHEILQDQLAQMRAIKDSYELACMQRAADAAVRAFEQTIARSGQKPYAYEYQIHAEYHYHCQQQGYLAQPYPAIVAGADRACVLHYTQNNQALAQDDLILMDAGCEVGHYASDITRVWPNSGRFSAQAQDVYQLVLQVQEALITSLKPGVSYQALVRQSQRLITDGLVSLGVLQGHTEDLVEQKAFATYFPHSFGHLLGLDVHDVGGGKNRGDDFLLQPGMVITVEPGLYFSQGQQSSSSRHYHGIGIRIEDDCLITAQGCQVLSKDLVKSVDEIQALSRGH